MIIVIDYGLGNLHSVLGALEKLDYKCKSSSSIDEMEKADKLILPGVGAFGDGMKNLHQLNLVNQLTQLVVKKKKPILGICLGFQLMAKDSSEFGNNTGLGWFDANVRRLEIDPSLRVPHVGWDELTQVKNSPLFKEIPKDALFYYTHSYHPIVNDSVQIIGTCNYGKPFVAAMQRDNIFGVQFHPEKSQAQGLALLKNFLTC